MVAPTMIKEHMEVLGSDGVHVSTVDHLEGRDQVKLTKDDPDAGGEHHFIPLAWVDHVDENVHLKQSGSESFFFSSRRRHTRWPRDWSSDVCSSDLLLLPREGVLDPVYLANYPPVPGPGEGSWRGKPDRGRLRGGARVRCPAGALRRPPEIGRASGRERGKSSGVDRA